jgi:NAD(P)-dependent dehydrogenase (short-subunit alcohol dehydrogenase family)
MKLSGKVVVITGASSGLGAALARAFSESGCKVVASSNDGVCLKRVGRELGVSSFLADVAKEKDVSKLAAFALEKFGRIDVWINNAGITAPSRDIEKGDMEKAHRIMEVNFFGTVYGTIAALAAMRKRKRGVIVNVISVRALESDVRPGIYSASKWAVRGFTEGLRSSSKMKDINVVAVYPGAIKTELWGKKRPAGYEGFMEPAFVARKIVLNLERRNPLRKLIMRKWKE